MRVNLFIFNSKKNKDLKESWTLFFKQFVKVAITINVSLYAFILIIDPYNIFGTTFPAVKVPVDANQRLFYPSIARSHDFNSSVTGTSTTRLLEPQLLNKAFEARFANLSMNSATPYEQYKIFEVFARNHPQPKIVIFGMDTTEGVWCQNSGKPEKFTFRFFPTWSFDNDTPLDDMLYYFNNKALEVAFRLIRVWLGWKAAEIGPDGYGDFTNPINKPTKYDLNKARINIYGQTAPVSKPQPLPLTSQEKNEIATIRFDYLYLLEKMVSQLPKETKVILLFPPHHSFIQPHPCSKSGKKIAACKKKIIDAMRSYDNVHVIDFMQPSKITDDDANYYDPLHYTKNVANQLVTLMDQAIKQQKSIEEYLMYLRPAKL